MATFSCQTRFLFFFFFFTLVLIINLVNFSHCHEISTGTKFELIHRHQYHHGMPSAFNQLDRLKQLLQSDAVRLTSISQKVNLHRNGNSGGGGEKIQRHIQEINTSVAYYHPSCNNGSSTTNHNNNNNAHNVSGEMPIHSGADYGTGQYFVHLKIGSPAQRIVLIADTGSDLTWMNCKYKCHGVECRRSSKKRRVFSADGSSSFKTVPCSSDMCRIQLANLFSLTRCPSPMDPCAYDYRYADGSSALGLFANETVTFTLTNGRKTRLHNVLVGCSESSQGQSFRAVDGVMGLGYSNYSFAVKATKRFGGKFSYCLVDHLSPKNISSYLIFGSHKAEEAINFNRIRYTELVLGVIPPFYAVNIKGISIGDSMLNIPAEIWNLNGSGGAILDSGSSLTALVQPAYMPVMAALRLSLLNFRNLNLDIGPLEYCFNSTGFDESMVPRLVFHFADGARFEPPVKSYVIDAAPGVKCLGFVPATWPGASVIGNIMQQNHFWEFDLANSRLGFASSSCISIDS